MADGTGQNMGCVRDSRVLQERMSRAAGRTDARAEASGSIGSRPTLYQHCAAAYMVHVRFDDAAWGHLAAMQSSIGISL